MRPGCVEFLEKMSKKFTLGIFTASNKDYADQILDELDPFNEIFSFRLYRDDCISHEGKKKILKSFDFKGLFVKNLKILENIRLIDCILVDNMICSYCLNLENGVPIKPYCDSNEDYELEFLAEKLGQIEDSERADRFIERVFGLKQFYQSLCL